MRDIRQIVADNGGDNTPGMDTHNLTGRIPKCEFCGDQKPLNKGCNLCNLCHKFMCRNGNNEMGFADND